MQHWVGTWATSPQLTEPSDHPPPPGLTDSTLRQVVRTSIGGNCLRLRLSNEFSRGPVTMNAVRVARAEGESRIAASCDTELTFSGSPSVTIPPGIAVWSDAFDLALGPLSRVAVTIAFGATPLDLTGHPGSRTRSYLVSGNRASDESLLDAASVEHWYYITGLDMMAAGTSRAVVTLGDSITDGRGSTTDQNDRWPDALARRLQSNAGTSGVAVLNQGIGGNAVVTGGLGPTALERFERDVLDQSAVRWVIVLEGVNDIGNSSSVSVASDLIAAYQRFVAACRARGILAYGVPILPFGGSQYDTPVHEQARQAVNGWIRAPGNFDAVIDGDAAVRDPAAPHRLLAAYDCDDHLHLSPAGYQRMADAVDLALFER